MGISVTGLAYAQSTPIHTTTNAPELIALSKNPELQSFCKSEIALPAFFLPLRSPKSEEEEKLRSHFMSRITTAMPKEWILENLQWSESKEGVTGKVIRYRSTLCTRNSKSGKLFSVVYFNDSDDSGTVQTAVAVRELAVGESCGQQSPFKSPLVNLCGDLQRKQSFNHIVLPLRSLAQHAKEKWDSPPLPQERDWTSNWTQELTRKLKQSNIEESTTSLVQTLGLIHIGTSDTTQVKDLWARSLEGLNSLCTIKDGKVINETTKADQGLWPARKILRGCDLVLEVALLGCYKAHLGNNPKVLNEVCARSQEMARVIEKTFPKHPLAQHTLMKTELFQLEAKRRELEKAELPYLQKRDALLALQQKLRAIDTKSDLTLDFDKAIIEAQSFLSQAKLARDPAIVSGNISEARRAIDLVRELRSQLDKENKPSVWHHLYDNRQYAGRYELMPFSNGTSVFLLSEVANTLESLSDFAHKIDTMPFAQMSPSQQARYEEKRKRESLEMSLDKKPLEASNTDDLTDLLGQIFKEDRNPASALNLNRTPNDPRAELKRLVENRLLDHTKGLVSASSPEDKAQHQASVVVLKEHLLGRLPELSDSTVSHLLERFSKDLKGDYLVIDELYESQDTYKNLNKPHAEPWPSLLILDHLAKSKHWENPLQKQKYQEWILKDFPKNSETQNAFATPHLAFLSQHYHQPPELGFSLTHRAKPLDEIARLYLLQELASHEAKILKEISKKKDNYNKQQASYAGRIFNSLAERRKSLPLKTLEGLVNHEIDLESYLQFQFEKFPELALPTPSSILEQWVKLDLERDIRKLSPEAYSELWQTQILRPDIKRHFDIELEDRLLKTAQAQGAPLLEFDYLSTHLNPKGTDLAKVYDSFLWQTYTARKAAFLKQEPESFVHLQKQKVLESLDRDLISKLWTKLKVKERELIVTALDEADPPLEALLLALQDHQKWSDYKVKAGPDTRIFWNAVLARQDLLPREEHQKRLEQKLIQTNLNSLQHEEFPDFLQDELSHLEFSPLESNYVLAHLKRDPADLKALREAYLKLPEKERFRLSGSQGSGRGGSGGGKAEPKPKVYLISPEVGSQERYWIVDHQRATSGTLAIADKLFAKHEIQIAEKHEASQITGSVVTPKGLLNPWGLLQPSEGLYLKGAGVSQAALTPESNLETALTDQPDVYGVLLSPHLDSEGRLVVRDEVSSVQDWEDYKRDSLVGSDLGKLQLHANDQAFIDGLKLILGRYKAALNASDKNAISGQEALLREHFVSSLNAHPERMKFLKEKFDLTPEQLFDNIAKRNPYAGKLESHDYFASQLLASYLSATFKYVLRGTSRNSVHESLATLSADVWLAPLQNTARRREANCAESNSLFQHLLESEFKIPTRGVSGLANIGRKNTKQKYSKSHPEDYYVITTKDGHGWSEVLIGKTWLTTDATSMDELADKNLDFQGANNGVDGDGEGSAWAKNFAEFFGNLLPDLDGFGLSSKWGFHKDQSTSETRSPADRAEELCRGINRFLSANGLNFRDIISDPKQFSRLEGLFSDASFDTSLAAEMLNKCGKHSTVGGILLTAIPRDLEVELSSGAKRSSKGYFAYSDNTEGKGPTWRSKSPLPRHYKKALEKEDYSHSFGVPLGSKIALNRHWLDLVVEADEKATFDFKFEELSKNDSSRYDGVGPKLQRRKWVLINSFIGPFYYERNKNLLIPRLDPKDFHQFLEGDESYDRREFLTILLETLGANQKTLGYDPNALLRSHYDHFVVIASKSSPEEMLKLIKVLKGIQSQEASKLRKQILDKLHSDFMSRFNLSPRKARKVELMDISSDDRYPSPYNPASPTNLQEFESSYQDFASTPEFATHPLKELMEAEHAKHVKRELDRLREERDKIKPATKPPSDPTKATLGPEFYYYLLNSKPESAKLLGLSLATLAAKPETHIKSLAGSFHPALVAPLALTPPETFDANPFKELMQHPGYKFLVVEDEYKATLTEQARKALRYTHQWMISHRDFAFQAMQNGLFDDPDKLNSNIDGDDFDSTKSMVKDLRDALLSVNFPITQITENDRIRQNLQSAISANALAVDAFVNNMSEVGVTLNQQQWETLRHINSLLNLTVNGGLSTLVRDFHVQQLILDLAQELGPTVGPASARELLPKDLQSIADEVLRTANKTLSQTSANSNTTEGQMLYKAQQRAKAYAGDEMHRAGSPIYKPQKLELAHDFRADHSLLQRIARSHNLRDNYRTNPLSLEYCLTLTYALLNTDQLLRDGDLKKAMQGWEALITKNLTTPFVGINDDFNLKRINTDYTLALEVIQKGCLEQVSTALAAKPSLAHRRNLFHLQKIFLEKALNSGATPTAPQVVGVIQNAATLKRGSAEERSLVPHTLDLLPRAVAALESPADKIQIAAAASKMIANSDLLKSERGPETQRFLLETASNFQRPNQEAMQVAIAAATKQLDNEESKSLLGWLADYRFEARKYRKDPAVHSDQELLWYHTLASVNVDRDAQGRGVSDPVIVKEFETFLEMSKDLKTTGRLTALELKAISQATRTIPLIEYDSAITDQYLDFVLQLEREVSTLGDSQSKEAIRNYLVGQVAHMKERMPQSILNAVDAKFANQFRSKIADINKMLKALGFNAVSDELRAPYKNW